MKHLVAKIHPADNVLVALTDLLIGTPVTWDWLTVTTLAGYITHPNVAGATVLSLGCQNAQGGGGAERF